MRLVCYAQLHPSECHIANGTLLGKGPLRISRLAIYDAGPEGVYLFSCDDAWRVAFDSWGESVDDTLRDAQHTWPRTSEHWVWP